MHYLQRNKQQSPQQPSYQAVMLPELVYDYVYAGRQPIPVALRDVKIYVKQIKEEIEKYNEEYEVRSVNNIKPSQTS